MENPMLILDHTAHKYVRFAPYWPLGQDVLIVLQAPQGELNKVTAVSNAASALEQFGKPDSEYPGLFCVQQGFKHGVNLVYVMRTDELPLNALRKLADDPTYVHAALLKRAINETKL